MPATQAGPSTQSASSKPEASGHSWISTSEEDRSLEIEEFASLTHPLTGPYADVPFRLL